eukprot:2763905-Rhodomonas_salina.1
MQLDLSNVIHRCLRRASDQSLMMWVATVVCFQAGVCACRGRSLCRRCRTRGAPHPLLPRPRCSAPPPPLILIS